MKRSLSGSKQQLPNMEELNRAAQSIDPAMMGGVQEALNRYGGKSEVELMGELAAARQSGLIDPAQLAAVAGRIAPMLSAEQRQRLDSILSQLK